MNLKFCKFLHFVLLLCSCLITSSVIARAQNKQTNQKLLSDITYIQSGAIVDLMSHLGATDQALLVAHIKTVRVVSSPSASTSTLANYPFVVHPPKYITSVSVVSILRGSTTLKHWDCVPYTSFLGPPRISQLLPATLDQEETVILLIKNVVSVKSPKILKIYPIRAEWADQAKSASAFFGLHSEELYSETSAMPLVGNQNLFVAAGAIRALSTNPTVKSANLVDKIQLLQDPIKKAILLNILITGRKNDNSIVVLLENYILTAKRPEDLIGTTMGAISAFDVSALTQPILLAVMHRERIIQPFISVGDQMASNQIASLLNIGTISVVLSLDEALAAKTSQRPSSTHLPLSPSIVDPIVKTAD